MTSTNNDPRRIDAPEAVDEATDAESPQLAEARQILASRPLSEGSLGKLDRDAKERLLQRMEDGDTARFLEEVIKIFKGDFGCLGNDSPDIWRAMIEGLSASGSNDYSAIGYGQAKYPVCEAGKVSGNLIATRDVKSPDGLMNYLRMRFPLPSFPRGQYSSEEAKAARQAFLEKLRPVVELLNRDLATRVACEPKTAERRFNEGGTDGRNLTTEVESWFAPAGGEVVNYRKDSLYNLLEEWRSRIETPRSGYQPNEHERGQLPRIKGLIGRLKSMEKSLGEGFRFIPFACPTFVDRQAMMGFSYNEDEQLDLMEDQIAQLERTTKNKGNREAQEAEARETARLRELARRAEDLERELSTIAGQFATEKGKTTVEVGNAKEAIQAARNALEVANWALYSIDQMPPPRGWRDSKKKENYLEAVKEEISQAMEKIAALIASPGTAAINPKLKLKSWFNDNPNFFKPKKKEYDKPEVLWPEDVEVDITAVDSGIPPEQKVEALEKKVSTAKGRRGILAAYGKQVNPICEECGTIMATLQKDLEKLRGEIAKFEKYDDYQGAKRHTEEEAKKLRDQVKGTLEKHSGTYFNSDSVQQSYERQVRF